jgi:penicillin amidase
LVLVACTSTEPSPLLEVPEGERWHIAGMEGPAFVVRTEANVPHIYAGSRADLARVAGFVQARDRYFEIDLARRLGLGELSALLGDQALQTDMESRGNGMTWIADRMVTEMSDPTRELLAGYAEGVNAYIEAVRAEALPPPSEYAFAAGLLGASEPVELMTPFDVRSMAGFTAAVVYNLGYETGDVGRARSYAQLPDLYPGAPLEEARRAGVYDDIWYRVEPVHPVSSAAGWGLETTADPPPPPRGARTSLHVPASLLDRVATRQERLQRRLGHDWENGFGSNAWAVMGTATADGRALLAGDGHLPLTVPSLFYRIGLDTAHLGGGDTHQLGLVIPGMPIMAVGTNGNVAWSQTQLMGDITDWYREEIRLDAYGEPIESLFQGEWMPLERFEETYVVADVPLLDSEGRTETWARWTTFDGRWIADIEGRAAGPGEVLGDGEALVNLQGDFVVPGDTDGDSVNTAVSFDYTGLDLVDLFATVDDFGHAEDVWAFREATRGLVAYSQNLAVADSQGSVLYTGYQAVPCRAYLPREADGSWAEGADPSMLLDGTTYGGFTIPLHFNGTVDESQADPYQCVVPFEDYPQALDPAAGFVQTANNDPGNISTDGSLFDDPWYIGGPWVEGYRAQRISNVLGEAIADGGADIEDMATLQGDHHSVLGAQFAPELLDAIGRSRALAGTEDLPAGGTEERLAGLYLEDADALDEVESRLQAWAAAGYPARSGVETFYDPVLEGDVDHAVATTIFNAWMGWYVRNVLGDEGLPGVWSPTGNTGRTRTLTLMLAGRGEGNPLGLSSWHPALEESAFFDILGTEELETSHEVALIALHDALAFLRSPRVEHGVGGFGSEDMDTWLWGTRHWVHFDSVLLEFLGGGPLGILVEQFSITTDDLPLGDDIVLGDPRYRLSGFPRHGDNLNVDAGNPGLSGERFSYGSGPVFRMVIALGPDGVSGQNIIPGGQSGLNDSPYFADQAALWLGNEAMPMRFTVEEVVEGGITRESYLPDLSWAR